MIKYFRFFLVITLSLSLTTNSLHSTSPTLQGLLVSGIDIVAQDQPVWWRSLNMGNLSSSSPTRSVSRNAITPLDPAKIVFQEIISGFINPIFITNAGDGSGRIFVLERAGRIRIIK